MAPLPAYKIYDIKFVAFQKPAKNTTKMKHQGADASVCIKITMQQTLIDWTEMHCFAICARIYTMAYQHVSRNQASVTTCM